MPRPCRSHARGVPTRTAYPVPVPLSLAVAGLLTGWALIAAVGAQNAYLLRQGIVRRHVGPLVALCALSDVVLILAAVLGIGALVEAWPPFLQVARWGGGAFLVGYGLFRFIAEFWREPDAHLGLLGLGFSMGQWLSLPMIVAGIALWSWARARAVSDVEAVDNRVDNSSDLVGDDSFEPEPAPGADARPTSGGASAVGDRADRADDRDGPAQN